MYVQIFSYICTNILIYVIFYIYSRNAQQVPRRAGWSSSSPRLGLRRSWRRPAYGNTRGVSFSFILIYVQIFSYMYVYSHICNGYPTFIIIHVHAFSYMYIYPYTCNMLHSRRFRGGLFGLLLLLVWIWEQVGVVLLSVWGFGFRILGLGFRISDLGFQVEDLELRVSDVGFRI